MPMIISWNLTLPKKEIPLLWERGVLNIRNSNVEPIFVAIRVLRVLQVVHEVVQEPGGPAGRGAALRRGRDREGRAKRFAPRGPER